jgi:hypothetical protein
MPFGKLNPLSNPELTSIFIKSPQYVNFKKENIFIVNVPQLK